MLTRMIDDSELVQGVIHEIKNPISLIKANIELVSLEIDGFNRHFEIINRELDYIEELVCDYLSTCHNIKMSDVFLHEILDDLIFEYRNSYNDITFNFIFENRAIVSGEVKMLKMALRNIYKNCVEAIKKRYSTEYDENFSGTINTFLYESYDGIKIVIKDNGIGEFDGREKRTRGMGLLIIEKIITLHKGDFKIYNDIKDGVVQEIYLRTLE
ncbi:MAG: histidine kinase dimerization/phospho-acceptor domain-containing protein [Lachnospirales bacterium]